MQEKVEHVSRMSFLAGSGKLIAGTAIASTFFGSPAKNAGAYAYKGSYDYLKLDPKEVGQITYENYFQRW